MNIYDFVLPGLWLVFYGGIAYAIWWYLRTLLMIICGLKAIQGALDERNLLLRRQMEAQNIKHQDIFIK
jgi:hypothetical protein